MVRLLALLLLAGANLATFAVGAFSPASMAVMLVSTVVAYNITDPVCEINMKITYDRISL